MLIVRYTFFFEHRARCYLSMKHSIYKSLKSAMENFHADINNRIRGDAREIRLRASISWPRRFFFPFESSNDSRRPVAIRDPRVRTGVRWRPFAEASRLDRCARMTQELSGVTIVIFIAAGVLTILLLFIFAKRQIMRFALRSRRGPHIPIGHDAKKVRYFAMWFWG